MSFWCAVFSQSSSTLVYTGFFFSHFHAKLNYFFFHNHSFLFICSHWTFNYVFYQLCYFHSLSFLFWILLSYHFLFIHSYIWAHTLHFHCLPHVLHLIFEHVLFTYFIISCLYLTALQFFFFTIDIISFSFCFHFTSLISSPTFNMLSFFLSFYLFLSFFVLLSLNHTLKYKIWTLCISV